MHAFPLKVPFPNVDCKNMLYGDRIRKPPGIFPEEYVEMRCFGSYEANCVRAVFFRLVEATVEQQFWVQTDSPALESLRRLCYDEEMWEIAEKTVRIMTETPENKGEIWGNVWKLEQKYRFSVQINPNNPFSFDPMCQTGNFALKILGTSLTVKLPSLEIALFQHKTVLFLLYSAFSQDSFLDFPCGHFCLKYDYYRSLQQMIGARAISTEEMMGLELKCNCGADIREAVYQSMCEKDEFPAKTAQNERKMANLCQICGKKGENQLPKTCSSHFICDICAIKHYMTAAYEFSPCCRQKMSDLDLALQRKAIEQGYDWVMSWVRQVKHDKRVAMLVQMAKPCPGCQTAYVLINIREKCQECEAKRLYSVPRSISTGIRHVSPNLAAQRMCPECGLYGIFDVMGEKCENCLRKKKALKPQVPASLPRLSSYEKSKLQQGKLALTPVLSGSKGVPGRTDVEGQSPAQGDEMDQGGLSKSSPGEGQTPAPINPLIPARKYPYIEDEKQAEKAQGTDSLFAQNLKRRGQFSAWKMCPGCQRSVPFDRLDGICEECRRKEEEMPRPRAPAQVPKALPQNQVLQYPFEPQNKQQKPDAKEIALRLGFPGQKPAAKNPTVVNVLSGSSEEEAQDKQEPSSPPEGQYDPQNYSPPLRIEEGDQFPLKPREIDQRLGMKVNEESKIEGYGRKRPVSAQITRPVGLIGEQMAQKTNCTVCQAEYTREDTPYFCPQVCRCRRCATEGLYGTKLKQCKYCRREVSQETWNLIHRDKKRCHFCGIVLRTEEMETNQPCSLCYQCVVLTSEKNSKKVKGQCPVHPNNVFAVNLGYYNELKLKVQFSTSACCPLATTRCTRLRCGHYVCPTHQEHLKYCRLCHAINN